MNFLKTEVRVFLASLSAYTRIPVSDAAAITAPEYGKAARYLPVIGMAVGVVGAGIFSLSFCIYKDFFIAAIGALIAMTFTTGAFHEDGLADFADGFGGGWTKSRILEIMKDSHIGPFGTITLIFTMGLKLLLISKFTILLHIENTVISYLGILIFFVAGQSLSRAVPVLLMHFMKYAREESSSKAGSLVGAIGNYDTAFAVITGLLPLVILVSLFHKPLVLLCLLPIGFNTLFLAAYFRRWIGGYTGDCLGASQQLTEVLFYLTILALWNFIW